MSDWVEIAMGGAVGVILYYLHTIQTILLGIEKRLAEFGPRS